MATVTPADPPLHQAPGRHQAVATDAPPVAARVAGIVVGLTLVLTVVFIAFALPAIKSRPHAVPLGVAGPGASAAQVEHRLSESAPGGFLVTNYGDEPALRAAILRRDVYGGIVLTPQGPTVLVAGGGSPVVAQSLTQLGSAMAQQSGAAVRTEDVAPLPRDDARGIGLSAAALPLTLAGLLPAVALLLAFPRRPWLRTGSIVVFAGVIAVTVTSLLRFVFGSIDNHFWAVSAGLSLGTLAMGMAVLGLGSMFGRVGIGISAATAVLLGNPLSGLAGAPELLPSGWGAFGQLLPQGATATLLRSTAYFPDPFASATATGAMLVLGCWALAGLALIFLAAQRNLRSSQ